MNTPTGRRPNSTPNLQSVLPRTPEVARIKAAFLKGIPTAPPTPGPNASEAEVQSFIDWLAGVGEALDETTRQLEQLGGRVAPVPPKLISESTPRGNGAAGYDRFGNIVASDGWVNAKPPGGLGPAGRRTVTVPAADWLKVRDDAQAGRPVTVLGQRVIVEDPFYYDHVPGRPDAWTIDLVVRPAEG